MSSKGDVDALDEAERGLPSRDRRGGSGGNSPLDPDAVSGSLETHARLAGNAASAWWRYRLCAEDRVERHYSFLLALLVAAALLFSLIKSQGPVFMWYEMRMRQTHRRAHTSERTEGDKRTAPMRALCTRRSCDAAAATASPRADHSRGPLAHQSLASRIVVLRLCVQGCSHLLVLELHADRGDAGQRVERAAAAAVAAGSHATHPVRARNAQCAHILRRIERR